MVRTGSLRAIALCWSVAAPVAAGEFVTEDFRVQVAPGILLAVHSIRTRACDPGRAPLLVTEDADTAHPMAEALAEAGYPAYRLAGGGPGLTGTADIAADIAALAGWIRARHRTPEPAEETQ